MSKNFIVRTILIILIKIIYIKTSNSIIQDFLVEFSEIVKNMSNQTLINEFLNDEECIQDVSDSFQQWSRLIGMIGYSGKVLMDIGSQSECEEDSPKNEYLFLIFSIDKNKYFELDDFHNLFLFTDQTDFFLGLCLWKECSHFYQSFFDIDLNQPFFDALVYDYGINNIKYQKDPKISSELSNNMIVALSIILTFLIFRILIILIGNILNYRENKKSEKEFYEFGKISQPVRKSSLMEESQYALVEDDSIVNYPFSIKVSKAFTSSLIDSDYSSRTSEFLSKIDSNKEEFEKDIKKCVECITDTQKFETTFNKQIITPITENESKIKKAFKSLYYIFSLGQSLISLFNVKNEFFDDTNLELISGIRSFILFWMTTERIIVYLYSLSYRFGNFSFYYSFGFIIIKYATFAVESTIFLDGIVYAYKLMFFLKKEKNYSFKTFMKFYFNILQKFFSFCFIFFFFTVNIDEIANFLNKTYIFVYFYKLINMELCMIKPYTILIPFYIQYIYEGKCDEFDYDHCLKYVYHCINECYCMFFTVILFYVLYKIRSKIFDICIALIILVNIILCWIYYTSLFKSLETGSEFYNLKYILGETRMLKQPHLLYFVFFLGVNCGLIYFYFIDSISESNKYLNNEHYTPFNYNLFIMRKIITLSVLKRYLIGFCALFIQLSICSIYPIMVRMNQNKDLTLQFNNFLVFIFIYEKKINIVLFALITLMLLFSSENFLLNKLFKSRILITFSRISFPFICLDIIVYVFFTFYDDQLYWNYPNILLFSFALYSFLACLNFILSCLFEVPIRILYKKLIRNNNQLKLT